MKLAQPANKVDPLKMGNLPSPSGPDLPEPYSASNSPFQEADPTYKPGRNCLPAV